MSHAPAQTNSPHKGTAKRVLVALDSSEGSACALRFALEKLLNEGDEIVLFQASREFDRKFLK
jgi:hypothetical protein